MIIVLAPKILEVLNKEGFVMFPFIVMKSDTDRLVFNHELIHYAQQRECLVIFAYLFYITEFIFKWVKYGNRKMAYMDISFEKEAYHNQTDYNYLGTRKRFSFLKYV